MRWGQLGACQAKSGISAMSQKTLPADILMKLVLEINKAVITCFSEGYAS